MPTPIAVKACADNRIWLRYDEGAVGTVDLSDLAGRGVFLSGTLPPRAIGLVAEWAVLHRQELLALWDRAMRQEALGRLEPLM